MFLTPDTAAAWLDTSVGFSEVLPAVMKASVELAGQLHIYEVPPLVSNMRNDTPECLLPKKEYDSRQLSKGTGWVYPGGLALGAPYVCSGCSKLIAATAIRAQRARPPFGLTTGSMHIADGGRPVCDADAKPLS